MSEAVSDSLADLLRRHRLTAGLTQEALAERAGLSVNGIQKLESGGTHPYRETIRRLVQALQLTPEDQLAFGAAAQTPPRHQASGARRTFTDGSLDLPAPLTSFIGRDHEKDEIARLLPATRLLTLTGVGGCGKTRLALEVARLVRDRYADGVRLAELASLADPALVPQAVADALGVRETPTQPLVTTLIAALDRRHLLLLLDNCEHLLDACAQLADKLLRGCPRLQILATSRHALGLAGEVSRRVPSLATPPVEPPPAAEQLNEYAAVQLFVERARAFSPDFAITHRNASAIARVCERLDGIPLALELAAALVRGLSVEDIAARLDQRFRLLTGGSRTALARQQTLRATIDWSYDLLNALERTLFTRLSVFGGRWMLEAAEEVCVGGGIQREQVLELLLHLVDKSLVVAEEEREGSMLYRLLESLRQYGLEHLHASGEFEQMRSQHASYYLTLTERAEPELNQPRQAAWIERLALEQSELLTAVEWLVKQDEVHDALRLAAVLGRFWLVRGHLHEGRRRLTTLLALPGAAAPTLARAKVLEVAGALAQYQGDMPASHALLKESLKLYRHHQHLSGVAWVLFHLGWLCHDHHREKAARRFLQEALILCRQLNDRRGIARCLNVLGLAASGDGDVGIARSMHQECLALSREVGDEWGTAWALTNLGIDLVLQARLGEADAHSADAVLEEGLVIWHELGERRHIAFTHMILADAAILEGNHALARSRLEQSLATFADLEDVVGMSTTVSVCSDLFGAHGQYEQAVRASGASYGQAKATGRVYPIYAYLNEQRLDSARRVLGVERFDVAWTEGCAMSLEAAVAYAHQQLRVLVPDV
jgi:predicted ATPase/DNA-binding XRE family transcriptional regulator